MKINKGDEFPRPSLLTYGVCRGFVVRVAELFKVLRTHLGSLCHQERDAQASVCRKPNLGCVNMAVFAGAFINEIFTTDHRQEAIITNHCFPVVSWKIRRFENVNEFSLLSYDSN